ncbi:hypothetical protein DFH08DRAFT_273317 [Mycena albidolilacea]|uniref:Uncharacterized protein n=1 Tax=Mycena albidolilacea TaxID=1033008 RepID=A0AAD7AP97_9AGAR|nr:hypothetical protein DFH08DRAFT_273317 [Mycena albidolilacea]
MSLWSTKILLAGTQSPCSLDLGAKTGALRASADRKTIAVHRCSTVQLVSGFMDRSSSHMSKAACTYTPRPQSQWLEVTQQPHGGIIGQQSAGISDMGIQNSPSFSQDAVVGFCSESGSYCSHLLRQGRGFPLYVPRPQRSLPEEYQRNGVAIGDVGRVTTEGVFDFFFNIYLAADHPINANFVPEDFHPLTPYVSRDVLQAEFDPGNYVSSAFIQAWDPNAVMDEFPGSEFLFSCMGPSGAVLALPHGAYLEKLEYVEHARRYAARNAESWYKYINETRGGGLTNGSLYLITGCEKSRSGGMASFQNVLPGAEFQLSFRPTTNADAGYKYRFNRGTPVKTKHFDEAEQHDEGLLNHTTFLHGFSISLGEGIWGRLFGKVTVSEIGESDMRSSPSGFVPFGQQGSLFSWSLNIFGGGDPTGGRKYTDQNEQEIIISEFSPMFETVHPGRTINNFLLRQYPEAAVVMTHDDDWRDIITKSGRNMYCLVKPCKGPHSANSS